MIWRRGDQQRQSLIPIVDCVHEAPQPAHPRRAWSVNILKQARRSHHISTITPVKKIIQVMQGAYAGRMRGVWAQQRIESPSRSPPINREDVNKMVRPFFLRSTRLLLGTHNVAVVRANYVFCLFSPIWKQVFEHELKGSLHPMYRARKSRRIWRKVLFTTTWLRAWEFQVGTASYTYARISPLRAFSFTPGTCTFLIVWSGTVKWSAQSWLLPSEYWA